MISESVAIVGREEDDRGLGKRWKSLTMPLASALL